MKIIDVFTIFSGLGLNSNKTVIIKTHPFTIDDAVFLQNSPWEDVKLLLSHVYLGVLFMAPSPGLRKDMVICIGKSPNPTIRAHGLSLLPCMGLPLCLKVLPHQQAVPTTLGNP